jgi:hypothetical protein
MLCTRTPQMYFVPSFDRNHVLLINETWKQSNWSPVLSPQPLIVLGRLHSLVGATPWGGLL